MEIMTIMENKKREAIYGLLGNINLTTNNENVSIVSFHKFSKTVSSYLASPKASEALKIVFLNDAYLFKTIKDLSEAEIKKINLAKSLLSNKEIIALNFFDKGLSIKEQKDYQRLFKKLSEEYHKTILIYTNDLTFFWNIATEILYVDNSGIINTYSKNEIIPKINISPIDEFINLMRSKNLTIENYKETNDLLKAIYRLKENKNEISN